MVAGDACPGFCCAISMGMPPVIAWLACECRIQCVLALWTCSAHFRQPQTVGIEQVLPEGQPPLRPGCGQHRHLRFNGLPLRQAETDAQYHVHAVAGIDVGTLAVAASHRR